MQVNKNYLKNHLFRVSSFSNILHSIWLFPILVTIVLIILTGLKVSGSSLEIYNWILGQPQGSNLIVNEPKPIRSDEWLVVTQLTVAQHFNNYSQVNPNIGGAQDMSLASNVPYKDWSAVFKPENWSFFVLPFEYAFAFKWWFMGYLLMLACYFFVLKFLPGKTLIAALVAIAFFFSPFVQWWYQFVTLASVYYALFIGLAFLALYRQKEKSRKILLFILLAYLLTAFALIIYPPFQIACILGVAALCLGYLLNSKKRINIKATLRKLYWPIGACFVAGSLTLAFLATRYDAVQAMLHTAYPGVRNIESGGFEPIRLFIGHLDMQLQNIMRADALGLNQSENSNFILLLPFLFLPSAYVSWRLYKKNKSVITTWPLILVNIMFLFLLGHLFVPHLTSVYSLLFLDKVPHQRLIIGFGFLSLLQFVLFIHYYQKLKEKFSTRSVFIYGAICLLLEILVGIYTYNKFPGFIGLTKVLLLSCVIPLVVVLVLKTKYTFACLILCVVSIASTIHVMPLYRGVSPLISTPISKEIRAINNNDPGTWVAEGLQFENFPQMNGADSLSGVFYYPQLDLWKNLPPKDPSIYNRYAHVVFNINHDESTEDYRTHIEKQQDDAFVVTTEPCSTFMQQKVKYILAQAPITNSCLDLLRTVTYPNQTFFIYRLR